MKAFSPAKVFNWSSFALYFSRIGPLAASCSGLKNKPLIAAEVSVKTERILST
jgi:hypothetical protein